MARPTPNNPTGAQKRPKLTPDTIKKLEQAFAIDASVREACYYADISEPTYYLWMDKYPKLLDRLTRLREKPVLTARQAIAKNLGDPDHAKWYLERKKKSEFSTRRETTGANGNPIETINYAKEAEKRCAELDELSELDESAEKVPKRSRSKAVHQKKPKAEK